MYTHSSGMSGLPYSPIQLAPARSLLYRFMSSSGTLHTTAPNRSGRCVNATPTSRPPLLPPVIPRGFEDVILRLIRSSAIARKSSYALWRFSFIADLCHLGPNSPPPLMFETTYTPPYSSHNFPINAEEA